MVSDEEEEAVSDDSEEYTSNSDNQEEEEVYDPYSNDELQDSIKRYKLRVQNKRPISLSSSETIPVSSDEGETDKSIAAKFMGFVKGKFDDISDNYKLKQEMKNKAYEDYLAQRPALLEKMYEKKYSNYYNKKLAQEGLVEGEKPNPVDNQRQTQDTFGKISGVLKSLGKDFGGAKSSRDVLGIGPRSYQPGPGYSQQRQYTYTGQQFPQYMARPGTAQPGSEWVRVSKVDKYGKKRSYMRKARTPEYNPSPNFGGMEPGQYYQMQRQQQGLGIPQEQGFAGVQFKPSNLLALSQTGDRSPASFTQGGNLNPEMFARGPQGMNVGQYLGTSGFNPGQYTQNMTNPMAIQGLMGTRADPMIMQSLVGQSNSMPNISTGEKINFFMGKRSGNIDPRKFL